MPAIGRAVLDGFCLGFERAAIELTASGQSIRADEVATE